MVTEDGRTYTAISRLEERMGWQLQAAVPLGTVISWLFARPEKGGQNGFSITGGVLNYTAEVTYPETGDRLSILFQFKVKLRKYVDCDMNNNFSRAWMFSIT